MKPQKWLGAALATTVAGALVLGVQGPSYTAGGDKQQSDRSDHVEQEGPQKRQAITAADRYLRTHAKAVRRGADDTVRRVAATPGTKGTYYVSYERSYRGLPVYGGDFVIAVDNQGRAVGATSGQERKISVATTPTVSKAAARKAAKRQVDRVRSISRPTLEVYAEGAPRLAWKTVVKGVDKGSPSIKTVWTDARTGKTLLAWDKVVHGTGNGYYYGNVTIGTSGSSGSYRMVDPARSGVQCGGQNGSAYTGPDDAWGNGSGTNLETACVDVMYATAKEVDMLSAWLGRSGVKGNGTSYPARVGLNDVNAYWNGSIVNFGHSSDNARQLTAIDIVAHEQGHGIFYTTPGGSSGNNETGGMNEATGDIFGALTEAYAANPNDPADFLVGEEADLVGDGPIRNMYNPSALGDPNCYSTSLPGTEVHAAAGPLNHWFVLLAQGSGGSPSSPTCNGSAVTGVGLQTAAKIFYNGLLLKTSSWNHGKARVATLTATKTLYGSTDCTTFNRVKAAWAAISVNAQAGEPTCGGGGDPDPGGDCTETTVSGSTARGVSVYHPSSSGFTTSGGLVTACLTGPSNADFDLYLQRKNGTSWQDVAASESPSSTETISYNAASGTYRIEVYGYSGSGSFTLKYNTP